VERDPENRLLARMNRRRLDAECVRDAMLAVAGTLDPALGGSLLATKNGDYVTNDQSANAAQYATARRSIYLPVIRNALYDVFGSFDYNDASMPIDQRPSTTDANQALLLMNSPLALETSAAFARSVLADKTLDDRARIDAAWRRAYGRAATEPERERALRYVSDVARQLGSDGDEARAAAWQSLCQVFFMSNEFLYVD
jgi:hypothetical protein